MRAGYMAGILRLGGLSQVESMKTRKGRYVRREERVWRGVRLKTESQSHSGTWAHQRPWVVREARGDWIVLTGSKSLL